MKKLISIVLIFTVILSSSIRINGQYLDKVVNEQLDMVINNFNTYLTGEAEINNELIMQSVVNHDYSIHNEKASGISDILNYDQNYLWLKFNDFNNSSHYTGNFKYIYEMAVAYSRQTSQFYKSPDILEDIIYTLEFMTTKYNSENPRNGNWWDYEIGSPLYIVKILSLMNSDLDEDLKNQYINTLNYFIPDPNYRLSGVKETGANLLDKAFIVAINSVLDQDTNRLDYSIDSINPVFNYVTSGDGFYEDGSFIQHNTISYIGSYGDVLLEKASLFIHCFKNSQLIPSDNSIHNIYNLITTHYYPMLYKGQSFDMARGRSIVRTSTNHYSGRSILSSILIINNTNPNINLQMKINSIVKAMILENNGIDPYIKSLNIYLAQLITNLLNNEYVIPEYEDRNTAKVFGSTTQNVIYRDGYAIAISGFSDKISSFESGNGENLKGFYNSIGTYYIHDHDQNQYDLNYYASIDQSLMPGTTTNNLEGVLKNDWYNYFNPSNKVGGVESNSDSVFSMEYTLENINESYFKANKTYTALNDRLIVSLGDIVSENNQAVSVLENRKMKGDKIYIDGVMYDEDIDLNTVASKIFIESNEGNYGTGFILKPTLLNIKREDRSGQYSQVNSNLNGQSTNNFVTISVNHDVENFQNFEYVLIPHITLEEFNQQAINHHVIENSANAQIISNLNYTHIGSVYGNYVDEQIEINQPISFSLSTNSEQLIELNLSNFSADLPSYYVILNGEFEVQNTSEYISSEYDSQKNRTKIIVSPKRLNGETYNVILKKV